MATQTMRFAMQTYVNPFVKSFDCPEMVLTRARPTPFTAITLKLPTNELKRFEWPLCFSSHYLCFYESIA